MSGALWNKVHTIHVPKTGAYVPVWDFALGPFRDFILQFQLLLFWFTDHSAFVSASSKMSAEVLE